MMQANTTLYNVVVVCLILMTAACLVVKDGLSGLARPPVVVEVRRSSRTWTGTNGGSEFVYHGGSGRSHGPVVHDKVRIGVDKPVILVWQAPYCPKEARLRGDGYCVPEKYTMPCSREIQQKCRITTNHDELKDADAVVIPLASKAAVSRSTDLKHLKSTAVVVSWGAEAPASPLGVTYGSDNNLYNWTMSYRKDSDVPFPYLWDIFFRVATEERYKVMRDLNQTMFELDAMDTKFPVACGIIGNCLSSRKDALNSIARHFPSTLKGRCWEGTWVHGKEEAHIYKTSLFHLAFENAYCVDYVTEKYWRVLTWGSIPLVNGPPEAYPGDAAINVNSFNTSKDLAEYLHRVASTPSLLRRHLAYRDHAAAKLHPNQANEIAWCNLCTQLTQSQHHQHYPSMSDWLKLGGDACPASLGASWSPDWAV
eukprot:TRINITY_DN29949_c0_g1_i1.p1 TRINITY_DN29949_c0_g1~~TRINITY_DN29949_c0_g1_i1.p1  ORF type:complete len:424 (+),score=42.94 TRINITY_DN29949_c0_g1_i1:3-1274(+)